MMGLREQMAWRRGWEAQEIKTLEEIIDILDEASEKTNDPYMKGVAQGVTFRLGLLLEAKKEMVIGGEVTA